MPTILVVDDARFSRSMVVKMLKGAGYETCEAADGTQALAVLDSRADIDAIVSDMLMPNLDGAGLLEALGQRTSSPPCIMVTADVQETTRRRCEELGCFAFVNKPPKPQKVLAAVAAALESVGKRAV